MNVKYGVELKGPSGFTSIPNHWVSCLQAITWKTTQALKIRPRTANKKDYTPVNKHSCLENGPFEDAFPIENGDIPASSVRSPKGIKRYSYQSPTKNYPILPAFAKTAARSTAAEFSGTPTLPETNIFAPENGWLEYDRFLLGWTIFRCYVSFRACNPLNPQPPPLCSSDLGLVRSWPFDMAFLIRQHAGFVVHDLPAVSKDSGRMIGYLKLPTDSLHKKTPFCIPSWN